MGAASKRRTQAQRREATIGKLLEATIEALAELGYAGTSVSQICSRAGVSQGGLFRHFGTRLDVIVAATEEIGARHIAQMHVALQDGLDGADPMVGLVRFIRGATRTPLHAAWHEVMVAARTDRELRERAAEPLARFETALLATTGDLLGLDDTRSERVGVVALSLMHMFDSEAVTTTVYPNPRIEAAREAWAAEILRRELAG